MSWGDVFILLIYVAAFAAGWVTYIFVSAYFKNRKKDKG